MILISDKKRLRSRSKPCSNAVILGSHEHRVAIIKQEPTSRAILETVRV